MFFELTTQEFLFNWICINTTQYNTLRTQIYIHILQLYWNITKNGTSLHGDIHKNTQIL